MRNAIPNENSPSIQATVASYVGIDRLASAAGGMGKRYAVRTKPLVRRTLRVREVRRLGST
jgi:hypothetical protein